MRRTGGFGDAPVRLRYTTEYFQMFDENAFTPQADRMTADAADTLAEFGAPPGEVFVATVDTRIEPARQWGTDGEVSLLDDAGAEPVLTAQFSPGSGRSDDGDRRPRHDHLLLPVVRLSDTELFGAMREQGIGDLSQVRLGILEPDGKFSFVTRPEHQPAPDKEQM